MDNIKDIKLKLIDFINNSKLLCGSTISIYDFPNAYTTQELICQLFQKMNEVITDVNKYSQAVVEVINYLLNNGLEEEVKKQLELWNETGKIGEIINQTLFTEILQNIEDLDNKHQNLNNKVWEGLNAHTNEIKVINDNLTNQETLNTEFSKADNDLKFKDTELQEEITLLQKELSATRIEFGNQPVSKTFTLQNLGNEFVPNSTFSNEELSTMRVETYYIQVTYKVPMPDDRKVGVVVGQCFSIGNNKWKVSIKDVTREGFKFCFIDTTTGEKITNTEAVSSDYATIVSFNHTSALRTTE